MLQCTEKVRPRQLRIMTGVIVQSRLCLTLMTNTKEVIHDGMD